ncbi:uncharacterized protein AC631_03988 [Debaryomyces fabryi]|uniref:NADP-dependent oxidoreductase domain-containing protein n=1 Tax=Debaryomyces fabryi TaxID=58627 RepID=A0A0V1PVH1_9ASCO|nr:uncharacterized protein AC631_03988 [Debaryomyces fabryi]KSA00241.1 hypothetical protein AC631_03988 [Debaryomyces fabryi]CUM46359.1 unnamed protein product [Debaryomyces fabryi]
MTITLVKPIGRSHIHNTRSIKDLPPLIIGGAVFNYIYTSDPAGIPAYDLLDLAFKNGLLAIDTSPYYGRSEELLGKALKQLDGKWARESYFICTKAGRIGEDEFDYSRESVRKSVLRSLERLNTTYLDLVYMHDIEFVNEEEIYGALKELRLMKDEGLVKNIGISGYPVKLLYKVALQCYTNYANTIGPIDAVLSYSNGCLQNTILCDLYQDFFDKCGIKKLMNGSILSMSLLNSRKTLDFHPASQELKEKIAEIAEHLKINHNDLELADLSTRFAYKKWLFGSPNGDEKFNNLTWNKDCSIVLGVSNIEELEAAISNYWLVKDNIGNVNDKDQILFDEVKDLLGPKHYNETWKSGLAQNNNN